MQPEQPTYRSYLLRLWQAEEDGASVWRASLQRSPGEERRGFAGLEQLLDFLRQETGAVTGGEVEADPMRYEKTV